jgi:hypothetical protein
MKLNGVHDQCAIHNDSSCGPAFFGINGHDMFVQGSYVTLEPGHTYNPGSLPHGSYTIKEMDVFQVMPTPPARIAASKGEQAKRKRKTSQECQSGMKHVIRFTDEINKSINAKHVCLLHAETEMLLKKGSRTSKHSSRNLQAGIRRMLLCSMSAAQ